MSDLNDRDIDAELLEAAKKGDINEVRRLISEGADVNAYDGSQDNSLYWAVKNDHSYIAKVLLDNGATFIAYESSRERHVLSKYEKVEAEHCKVSLHLAARLGDLKAVKDLLKKEAHTNVNAQNDKGQTPFDLAVDEEIKDLLQSVKEANDKLLEAAKSGNIGDIENLLNEEGKAQVNATDQYGATPLHLAAENGHTDIVNALLNEGADVNAKAVIDITPLLFAAQNGHEGVVKVLLTAKEIDVNTYPQALYFAAKDGHEGVVKALLTTEIDVKTLSKELVLAAQNGHEGVVKVLLTAEIDVNEYFRALFLAAQNGHEGVVKVLLTTEKVDVAAKDDRGKTLLHWAAEKGYTDIVNTLLGKGADVNAKDNYGETPIYLALQYGHVDVAKVLSEAKGININIADKNGKIPLDWAIDNKYDIVQSLLSKLADVNLADEGGRTLLHWAAERGYVEIVNTLLGKGANVNAKNDKRETPLYLAVESVRVDVVKALIKEGADVNKARGFTNLNDETYALLKNAALLEAAKNDDVDEVTRLISSGANVNVQDKDGRTPLHLAAANGHTKIVSALIKREGINVYAEDNKNNAPLDLARQNDYKEVVKVLEQAQKDIEALCSVVKNGNAQEVETLLQELLKRLLDDLPSIGANVNIVGEDGKTPLHLAVLLNKTEMVKILIDYSKNVNIVDEDGKTPLHLAAANDHKEVVEVLLKAEGINVNAVDEDGKTPLDLTTNEEIKTLLQNAEKTDLVDESSTDSKGDQEEDAGTQQKEKQEDNAQPGSDITEQEADKTVNSGSETQTEEQPSSFFGSLFSILMKPFSLIASFFGGFFSWLFGSDEPMQSSSESEQPVVLELPSDSGGNDII
uniref:ANK_REP_REGION domain-containing protein n=1 Tax=Glossina austeni TaxID=7395 RepID=A0A1A9VK18_GLOAU